MSAYAAICAKECPQGCGGKVLRFTTPTGFAYHVEGGHDDGEGIAGGKAFPCTAPTKDTFIERQASELDVLRKRADQLTGNLADAEGRYSACYAELSVTQASAADRLRQIEAIGKERDAAQAEVRELRDRAVTAHRADMQAWHESPAFQTFVALKHSRVGQILVMLQDGQISRGRACEALAELAHGAHPDEVRLPEVKPAESPEDEMPCETIANLREEVRELREKLAAYKSPASEITPRYTSVGPCTRAPGHSGPCNGFQRGDCK